MSFHVDALPLPPEEQLGDPLSLILALRCSLPTSERVQALRYLQLTRQLLSCSADGGIAVWNMDTQREEVCALIPASPVF